MFQDILAVAGGNKDFVVGFSIADSAILALFLFLAIFLALVLASVIIK